MPKMIWLGMDVHAASITVAQYEDQAPTAMVQTIANDPAQVRRLVRRLPAGSDVRACYEAGSCGYGLHRQLTALGVHCDVIAPALIPRRPGERIKTDRRDAEKLGRFYRSGELTTITVPTPSQEGVRDLVRAREDVRRDRTAARQRLAKFLLRHGHRYPGSHWTKRHWEWVCGHTFDGPARTVFVHYCDHVLALNERLAHLEREIRTLAESAAYQPVVTRLSCLRGLATLSALVLIAELYDLRRFRTPRELMAYLGLVPSEHSSGARERRGRITKTGNALARRLLIEAAWAYRHPARQTRRVHQALTTQPPEVHAISDRALHRLTARYRRPTPALRRLPSARSPQVPRLDRPFHPSGDGAPAPVHGRLGSRSQSDGDADAPPPERDAERGERRERGDHGRHAGQEREALPPPEDEPCRVVDEHVLQHPGGERVGADREEPGGEGHARALEGGGGKEERGRGGGRYRHEARGPEHLVEGDARQLRRRAPTDAGHGGRGRASDELPLGRAGLEPAPHEQAGQRERHEGEPGERVLVHLGRCTAEEEDEEPEPERRHGPVRQLANAGRHQAAQPERLQHSPPGPFAQRQDAEQRGSGVEHDAETDQEQEAAHGGEPRAGGREPAHRPLA